MRRLIPAADDTTSVSDPDLPALYAYPPPDGDRPWLRANMISSLDGSAHGPDGLSASLGTPRDALLLGLLRALADVIVVGSGTVRAEGYGPAEPDERFAALRAAAGQPPTPSIAVVSRSLDLDPDAPLFAEAPDHARTVIITVDDSQGAKRHALADVADVVMAGGPSVDPHRLVAALADRGHRRLLTEGGPHLLRDLVAADVVDELCLTISLRSIGGTSGRILEGAPVDPHLWRPELLLLDDELMLGRWFRDDRSPARVRHSPH